MAISSTDRRAKNVQIFVEKDAVETSFAKWAQPGHFSRTLAKGPKTTTWIWNLHADAHDFDSRFYWSQAWGVATDGETRACVKSFP